MGGLLPRLAAVLGGLAVLLAPAAGRADRRADTLLRRVEAAYRAAPALTAGLSMRVWHDGRETELRGTVRLSKPNLARVELSGPYLRTLASDGRTRWELFADGRCEKKRADPHGLDIEALWAKPVVMFFVPEYVVFGAAVEPMTRHLGRETFEGRPYQVLELRRPELDRQVTRLYVGRDRLVHRMAATLRSGEDSVRVEAVFRNIRVGKRLPTSAFAYRPPATARVYVRDGAGMPGLLAPLIPVGQPAPDFDLETPSGGRISLKDALRGKKALLLNFWFHR